MCAALDLILAGEVDMITHTPHGNSGPRVDGYEIRAAAVGRGVPCITTVQGAAAGRSPPGAGVGVGSGPVGVEPSVGRVQRSITAEPV